MRLGILAASAVALLVLAAVPAQADTLEFILTSHPGGNQNPPPYGVRFDEVLDVTGGHDVFTMNFSDPSSNMRMVLNTADAANGGMPTIHIFGTAYGGLDIGLAYDPNWTGLWAIDFTYTANIQITGNEWRVTAENQAANQGTLTALFNGTGAATGRIVAGDVYNLYDEEGTHGYSFEFDDDGHRGGYPFAGRGWMNHDGEGNPSGDPDHHIAATDWLFVGTPVPEPGTLALLLGGFGFAAVRRRRRA